MTKKTPQHYVVNKEFLDALVIHAKAVRRAKKLKTEKPRVSEYLGTCLLKIAEHLAFKPNFINYTFREEMINDAIENCLMCIDNFNPKKSKNPFAYFTQISYYAFVRRILREKKQQHIKYRYIESLDINPELLTSAQQGHDGETYGNEYIDFLKKEVDIAHQELEKERLSVKKPTRKPKYMTKMVQLAA